MALAGHRSDTWRIEVTLFDGDTKIDLGVWDKKDGGEVDSDNLKHYPGGMEDPEDLGGRRTTGNITLTTRYGVEFFDNKMPAMLRLAGRGRATVHQTPLDNDGHPYGRPIIANGIFKRVSSPGADNEGGSPANIEIEVGVSGFPTMGDKNNAA